MPRRRSDSGSAVLRAEGRRDIDLDDVFAFVNETALFKGQWQYKQGRSSKEDYAELLKNTVYPKYEAIKEKAKREKLLEPKVVYGYFPCQSEGNDLIIYTNDLSNRTAPVQFPAAAGRPARRQESVPRRFFRVARIGQDGHGRVPACDNGPARERIRDGAVQIGQLHRLLLFHGLSVESAEALAEMWHKRIREELGIAGKDAPELAKLFHQGYQGSRYSFGYPACPNLEDQAKMFELIPADAIGVELFGGIPARTGAIDFGDNNSSPGREVFQY